jgi:hypothetical protein
MTWLDLGRMPTPGGQLADLGQPFAVVRRGGDGDECQVLPSPSGTRTRTRIRFAGGGGGEVVSTWSTSETMGQLVAAGQAATAGQRGCSPALTAAAGSSCVVKLPEVGALWAEVGRLVALAVLEELAAVEAAAAFGAEAGFGYCGPAVRAPVG